MFLHDELALQQSLPDWVDDVVEQAAPEWTGPDIGPDIGPADLTPPWWVLLEQEAGPPPDGDGQPVWAVPDRRVEALRTALRDLAEPGDVSGREALTETAELLALSQEFRLLLAGRLGRVERYGWYELDAARSTKAWAQRITPDLPGGDVKLGRDLLTWPLVSAAAHERAISIGTATTLAWALASAKPHLDQPGGEIDGQDGDLVVAALARNTVQLVAQCTLGLTDEQFETLNREVAVIADLPGGQVTQVEAAFVLLARNVSASVLPGCLEQQLGALLPSRLESAAERAHDRRFLKITQKPLGEGTRTVIDADVETSELLHTCLQAAARRDPAGPADTATAASLRDRGFDPYDQAVEPGPRSRGQRLHDALVRILEHYRDTGAGTADKQPVRITVTCSSDLLDGRPGALPALGASGQTLPTSLVKRWWCDAGVTTLLMSRDWRALGDTHEQRTLTGRERRALNVQDRRLCARDGCCDPRDPLTTYEPHHVQRFAHSGTTTLYETILVCASLHHDLHHGRTVRLRDGRLLTEQGWVDAC